MKKILYSLFVCILVGSCAVEPSKVNEEIVHSVLPKSTHITMSIPKGKNKKLRLVDETGLKAGALDFISVINQGDTVYWHINEASNIASIENIITINADEEDVFENSLVFNDDKTECYAVVSCNFHGDVKYDIEYVTEDGVWVRVDPTMKIKIISPPPRK